MGDLGHEWQAVVGSRTLIGTGYPACAEYGFRPDRNGTRYLLKHPSHHAHKLGITNATTRQSRVVAFQRSGWELLHKVEHPIGGVVREADQALLRRVRNDFQLPSYMTAESMNRSGWTETFARAGSIADVVISRMKGEFDRAAAQFESGWLT